MRGARTTAAVLVLTLVACTGSEAVEADPAAYRDEMNALCASTAADRAALVVPEDTGGSAGVRDFAGAVATVLGDEAEAARGVAVPGELDDDHRAFVQNTDDQSRAWTTLAATSTDDPRFGEIQTEILQLTLGRDDLSTEMGLDQCRVTGS